MHNKRLIDLDKLFSDPSKQIVIGAGDNICIDIADIAKEPIVDAMPIIHARWIEDRGRVIRDFVCSNCGKHENPHTAIKGHYCWFCGAKMDL